MSSYFPRRENKGPTTTLGYDVAYASILPYGNILSYSLLATG